MIKTTVKKLPFYGRTTERNSKLFFTPTVGPVLSYYQSVYSSMATGSVKIVS